MKKENLIPFLILTAIIIFILYTVNTWGYCCGPQNSYLDIQKEENVVPKADYAYIINFTFDNGDEISVKYPYTFSPDQSLLDIIKNVSEEKNWTLDFEDYGDMGTLVTQIDESKNGQGQKYWQYFIDGEQPQMSVDKYYPPFGTKIDWKFIKSEY